MPGAGAWALVAGAPERRAAFPPGTLVLAGLLVGFGLRIAQMVDPLKVLAFLDLAGAWDPSLLVVLGRYLFAIGKNEEAARYSGIATRRITIAAYVACCGLTALSAILFAMYTRSISPAVHGNFYELYAIAAAVLGGFSLRGGEGSVFGVVLGTILLQVLQDLVNLLGIPSSLNFAVMGSVILLGVLADQQVTRYRARSTAAKAAPERAPAPGGAAR